MKNGIRWENYCNNIGDYLRNPFMLRFIKEWYAIKNENKLKIWSKTSIIRTQNKKEFSSNFYDFIESTFKDRSEMTDFLDYIREKLAENPTLIESLEEKYEPIDFAYTLLALDTLNNELYKRSRTTIQDAFSVRINDIIDKYNTRSAYVEDKEWEKMDYRFTQLHWLREAIANGAIPIDSDGEILIYVSQDKEKYIMAKMSTGTMVYVDKNGNRLDKSRELIQISSTRVINNRADCIRELGFYDEILRFCESEVDERNESAMSLYEDLEINFCLDNHTSIEEFRKDNKLLPKFIEFIEEERSDLDNALNHLDVKDVTHIYTWEGENKKHKKPVGELPAHPPINPKIPNEKWPPQLIVIQKQQ